MILRRTPLEPWAAARLGANAAGPLGAELRRLQLERLRRTVEWAAERSPFYRRRLAGVDPSALASLEDVATLPFTTVGDLREHGEEMVCVSQDELARVVTLRSSGTTGAPKRLWFTAADHESILDFFQHGMSTLVEPGERVLILLPGPLPGSVGALLATALERLGAVPVLHGAVLDLPAAVATVARHRPTSVVGAPVQVLVLQRWAEEVAGVEWRPRTALLTTDHVPRSLAHRLEEAAGTQVFEHYGMTEMGLGGAVECAAHAGYHLREPDLLFEVVDPATGEVLPDGAPGEVVFTTLTRRGMPLVRYRTGDRSRFVPGRCPCGSVLRRLARIRGRIGGRTVACGSHRDVTLAELDEVLFSVRGLVDYTAAAGGAPGRTRLEIRARWLGTVPRSRDWEAVAAALARIPPLLAAQTEGTLSIDVEVGSVGERPWTELAKRVIGELGS